MIIWNVRSGDSLLLVTLSTLKIIATLQDMLVNERKFRIQTYTKVTKPISVKSETRIIVTKERELRLRDR